VQEGFLSLFDLLLQHRIADGFVGLNFLIGGGVYRNNGHEYVFMVKSATPM
jgi:hypothetical protein